MSDNIEYRYKSIGLSDVPYIIEKRVNGGKWKYCFGVCTYKEAIDMVNNPDAVEKQLKVYNYTAVAVIIFLLISAIVISINGFQ